ncbi:MAG TPA: outer membrane beta-barrel protein [Anaeromyxobacter sp.]
MRKLFMLGSLIALLVPTASHAQFQVGARLGFAPAMGDAEKDAAMSDGVKSQIPLQLDGFYKVNKDLAVGLYFAYGIAQLNSDLCVDGVTCSANDIRVGVQGTYTFNEVKAPLVPWAGIGVGYERGSFKQEFAGLSQTTTLTGYDLSLQAGGDYKVNDKFSVGPYLQISIAQYGHGETKGDLGDASGSITDKALHQWLGFGVAGKFNL